MTYLELNRVRDLHKRIRDMERHLAALRMSMANITPVIDGLPHSSEIKSRVEKIALKILEEEKELSTLREQYANDVLDIEAAINSAPLTLQEKTILLMRYVACKNFQDIWLELGLSDARVFFLHRRAQKIFSGIKVKNS